MTDRVFFQTGDTLSEQALGESRAQYNSTDYVERGLDVSVDWVDETIQITEGVAFLEFQNREYTLGPDERAGLALADPGGLNYVHLAFDPDQQNAIEYRVETDQTTSEPALLIAVADGTDESVETRHRAPTAEYEALDTEETTTKSLKSTGDVEGTIAQAGKVTFTSEFVGDILPNATHDPDIISRQYFEDGMHRVIAGNANTDNTYLYRTADFELFEELATDILPNTSGTGQVSGATILNDGTALFLESRESAGDVTILWTGPDFQNLTEQGQFCDEPDGGIFYERESGTLHYYPEGEEAAEGVGSKVISHWTASDDDLLNATRQGLALDLRDDDIKSGDVHVIELGDWYYMFYDYAMPHPTYRIGVAAGRSLDRFESISHNITPDAYGGDLTVVPHNGHFEALCEYSQDAETIGHWRLWASPISPSWPSGATAYRTSDWSYTDTDTELRIPFEAVKNDDGDNWDLSLNGFVSRANGTYHVEVSLRYNSPPTGRMNVELRGGDSIVASDKKDFSTQPFNFYTTHLSADVTVTAGEMLHVNYFGDNEVDVAGSETVTWMSVTRIA